MDQDTQDGMGDSGTCVCLTCGVRIPRQINVTCQESYCPNCGDVMVGEGSPQHEHAVLHQFTSNLRAAMARRGIKMKSRRAPLPSSPAK